jgi:hypothetical protein
MAYMEVDRRALTQDAQQGPLLFSRLSLSYTSQSIFISLVTITSLPISILLLMLVHGSVSVVQQKVRF